MRYGPPDVSIKPNWGRSGLTLPLQFDIPQIQTCCSWPEAGLQLGCSHLTDILRNYNYLRILRENTTFFFIWRNLNDHTLFVHWIFIHWSRTLLCSTVNGECPHWFKLFLLRVQLQNSFLEINWWHEMSKLVYLWVENINRLYLCTENFATFQIILMGW